MPKKTIKDLEKIIKELEKDNLHQMELNRKLNNEINAMQEKADNHFLNSGLHKQLLRENRTLKVTIESKDRIISHLENKQQEINGVQKIKNERGAGRKSKINDDVIRAVTMLRLQGKSVRAIALEIGLSIGTVQKIINEHVN